MGNQIGQVKSSNIRHVNWLTDPHINLLSRFRSFKRSKHGDRLPVELIDIIEDNIFGSLTSYNAPNDLMTSSWIISNLLTGPRDNLSNVNRSINSLYELKNDSEGDRFALAIINKYDMLPRIFLRFVFAIIDSGNVSDQLINDIVLNKYRLLYVGMKEAKVNGSNDFLGLNQKLQVSEQDTDETINNKVNIIENFIDTYQDLRILYYSITDLNIISYFNNKINSTPTPSNNLSNAVLVNAGLTIQNQEKEYYQKIIDIATDISS